MQPGEQALVQELLAERRRDLSLDSSLTGNGSEPNFRTVTRLLASFAGKPPIPPAVIWTWPFGIASLIRGAEMTAPSRTIAKYSLTWSRV